MAGELHPAEAAVREAHAAELERDANLPGLEPDIARSRMVRARAIRSAMPILDFKRAIAVYEDSLDDGPSPGLDRIDYQTGVREAQAKLRDAHAYPPDLERAVDALLVRGVSPDDIDLYAVTGIPAPDAEKSRSLTRQEYIEKQANAAVAKAMGDVNSRLGKTHASLSDLRKDLDEYKAVVEARFPGFRWE